MRGGYKETEIGLIPEDWQVVKLGEVAKKIQYGYTAPAQTEPIGPKMLRITDIQDGKVEWDKVPYCRFEGNNISKYLLEPGDILFARTGSVGKTYLVSDLPVDTIFASYLVRIKVDESKIYPAYAFLFTQSKAYWSQVVSLTHGAVQPNLNATRLKSILLPLPPLEEQKEIAQILLSIDQRIQAEEKKAKAIENLFKSLLHNLMTGKIRIGGIKNAEEQN